MKTITSITKTVSRSGIPITTITTITGISQTTPVRDGWSSNLGDCGGGSIADSMAVSQSGGGIADLGDVRNRSGCYGRHSGGGSIAESLAVSVTQTAVAEASKTTLLLLLFSAGADGQNEDDASLRQTEKRR
jgi:hypothetical protein